MEEEEEEGRGGCRSGLLRVPLVVGETRRVAPCRGKGWTFRGKRPWAPSYSGIEPWVSLGGAPLLGIAVGTGARRCLRRSCRGSQRCVFFLNGKNFPGVKSRLRRSAVFVVASVNVLQSELFVYLELSTAGNARLFAIRDIECNAVPVCGVLAAYCIDIP